MGFRRPKGRARLSKKLIKTRRGGEGSVTDRAELSGGSFVPEGTRSALQTMGSEQDCFADENEQNAAPGRHCPRPLQFAQVKEPRYFSSRNFRPRRGQEIRRDRVCGRNSTSTFFRRTSNGVFPFSLGSTASWILWARSFRADGRGVEHLSCR